MGCCGSKESGPEETTPYPSGPRVPTTSREPAPSRPRNSSYARRSASVNSSLAPATGTGLDSSRTNIIQPPLSPSPSPHPQSAPTVSRSIPVHRDPLSPTSTSRRNPRRRSLFARAAPSPPTPRSPNPRTSPNTTGTAGDTYQRPNAPLRAPSPVPASPRKPHIPDALQPARPWTRRVLAQQRAEFFDTQTGGREEGWAVLVFVCEAMRDAPRAEESDGDGSNTTGLQAAQGILDAAGLTCPTGRMRDGVYDEQGNRYVVPTWVVRDPEDVVEEEEDTEDEKGDEEAVMRMEKGKGRMLEEEEDDRIVTVRIRRSDPETNYTLRMGKAQSVGTLVECFRVEAQLPADAKIRTFFLGKQMSDSKSLSAQTQGRWKDGDVVIAFVQQQQ